MAGALGKWLGHQDDSITSHEFGVIQSDSELSEDSAEELQERDLAPRKPVYFHKNMRKKDGANTAGRQGPGHDHNNECFYCFPWSSSVAEPWPATTWAMACGGDVHMDNDDQQRGCSTWTLSSRTSWWWPSPARHGLRVYLAKLERSYNVQRNSVTASPRAEKNSALCWNGSRSLFGSIVREVVRLWPRTLAPASRGEKTLCSKLTRASRPVWWTCALGV